MARLPASTGDGREYYPLALTPDGLVVASAQRLDPVDPLDLIQAQPLLTDPRTGESVPLAPRRRAGPARQIVSVDATRRWIAWGETPSTNLSDDDWSIYTYDRDSGAMRRVAQAPDVGVPPPYVPDGGDPTISGGRVYYTAVQRVTGEGATPAVYSVPADGRAAPRLEQPQALFGSASAGQLVYLKLGLDHLGRDGWQVRSRLGGRERVLASGRAPERVSSLTTHEGTTTWVVSGRRESRWLVERQGIVRTVLTSRHSLYYPEGASSYAVICLTRPSGLGKPLLYDVATRRLRLIAADSGCFFTGSRTRLISSVTEPRTGDRLRSIVQVLAVPRR